MAVDHLIHEEQEAVEAAYRPNFWTIIARDREVAANIRRDLAFQDSLRERQERDFPQLHEDIDSMPMPWGWNNSSPPPSNS